MNQGVKSIVDYRIRMEVSSKPGFRLGITGGIGSGKTSVCRVFSVLGIPVFSADRIAQEIMASDPDIRHGINTIAGRDLYSAGSLDKLSLSALIFNDQVLLERVNSLVHPVVFSHFAQWVSVQSAPYVIMEAAILFESGASRLMDRIVTITAPENERIDRVVLRNRMSKEQVLERMKNQMDDESKIRLSDYVIHNSENDMIIPVILDIHADILKLLNTRN